MRHTVLSAFVLLMITPSLFARHRAASDGSTVRELLGRSVAIPSAPQSVTAAFQSLMLASGTPGGDVTAGGACGEEPETMTRLRGTTLREALESITRADPHYHWSVSDGVVDLLPGGVPPALLRVRITYFDSGPATDIVSAGTFLFALPEVRAAAARLGLTRSATSGSGLSSLLPGAHAPRKRLDLRLRDVTVLDALNAIVRVNKGGVWMYSETRCKGLHLFDLNFSR
jgi:hypothetical protein